MIAEDKETGFFLTFFRLFYKIFYLFDWSFTSSSRIFHLQDTGHHFGGRKAGKARAKSVAIGRLLDTFPATAREEASKTWAWTHSGCISKRLTDIFRRVLFLNTKIVFDEICSLGVIDCYFRWSKGYHRFLISINSLLVMDKSVTHKSSGTGYFAKLMKMQFITQETDIMEESLFFWTGLQISIYLSRIKAAAKLFEVNVNREMGEIKCRIAPGPN